MTPLTPSNLSSGVTASLVAIAASRVDVGVAYCASPPLPAHRGPRFRARGAASSLAASFDAALPDASLPGLSPPPYLRIQKRGRHYDVQTAITTFQKSTPGDDAGDPSTTTVDLHAQIHFGDASYFQYFNDDAFDSRYDRVLYELITEDRLLVPCPEMPHLRQLAPAPGNLNPLAPTPADRATAAQYGLQCQMDGIRYCREGWIHADLTREEFLGRLEEDEPAQRRPSATPPRRPLWALASTAPTYPGAELVASLARPLSTTTNSASAALTRRLFTNLFLPGDALSGWLRAAMWLGVPSPELSILLVDWSSLSNVGRPARRRASAKDAARGVGPLSPIAVPVLQSLLTGRWGTARRLIFGQVLVSGQASADRSRGSVLIQQRNDRALDVLRAATPAGEEGGAAGRRRRVALLYGAGHCRDLHRRLAGEEGMTPTRTEWRTAFRATAPRWRDLGREERAGAKADGAAPPPSSILDIQNTFKTMSATTLESAAAGLVILPLYLCIGGLDWVSTMGDVGSSINKGFYLDGCADILLYLVRHAALYVGISKFVVDWGGNEGIFEEDEMA